MPILSLRARSQSYEARVALDLVLLCSLSRSSSIDLEKLNSVTVFSFELIVNLVPMLQKHCAIGALGHVKINDDQTIIAKFFDGFLKSCMIVNQNTLCLFPPVAVHLCKIKFVNKNRISIIAIQDR